MVSVPALNHPSTASATPARLRRLRRFLRSPKGYLMVALLALTALAAPQAGLGAAAPILFWAVAGATGMEIAIVRIGAGVWRVPSSALLSGLIVGLILGPYEPWYTALFAGVIATDAKHLLRAGRAHIFNPAAFGLLAAYAVFGTGQSWWGALPELPALLLPVLLVACYLVAERANKLPAALAFLGVYYLLFTARTFIGDGSEFGDVFRPPFLNATLFFAFFMVTDPPTSPVQFREQIWFGSLVAVLSAAIYMAVRGIYFLPLGILIGNAVYALWRMMEARRKTQSQPDRRLAQRLEALRDWGQPEAIPGAEPQPDGITRVRD